MIASNFNIRELLSMADAVDYDSFLCTLEREATETERLSYRPGVTDDRRAGAKSYAKELKDLMFTLRYNARPPGLTHDEFVSLLMMSRSVLDRKDTSQRMAHKNFQPVSAGFSEAGRCRPAGH